MSAIKRCIDLLYSDSMDSMDLLLKEQARAEHAALEADSRRWRWLLKHEASITYSDYDEEGNDLPEHMWLYSFEFACWADGVEWGRKKHGPFRGIENLNAAIDAAIAQEVHDEKL